VTDITNRSVPSLSSLQIIFFLSAGFSYVFLSLGFFFWLMGLCFIQGYSKLFGGVLTTSHTQYTCDSSLCNFVFNRTKLQDFVTYLRVALCILINKKIHILLPKLHCV